MTQWPHSPSHKVTHPGMYILTSATYHQLPIFGDGQRLDLLYAILLSEFHAAGWDLQAWAVFPNHYHIVGHSPESGLGLTNLARRIHGRSAIAVNRLDGTPGRKVWYQTWDSRITFEKSYLARLAYVHNNPVKHGLVADARQYKWCSAQWFHEKGHRPFVETVMSFRTDRVNVFDDF